jgi:hypothetical protein
MFQMEMKLCAAADIKVRNMQPLDVYLIAGKILNDPELTKRAVAEQLSGAVLPAGSRETVLLDMTEGERAALRERVLER